MCINDTVAEYLSPLRNIKNKMSCEQNTILHYMHGVEVHR